MVRVKREKLQSGRKKDKRFESEGGVRVLHLQKGARLSSAGIPAGGVRGGSHSAGRRRISKKAGTKQGVAPRVRAAKSSDSRKGE